MPRGSKPGERRGGRQKGSLNKVTRDVKLLAQKHGPECIAGLAVLAKTAENETARIAAMRELLDRAYGRPAQAITDADGGSLTIPAAIQFVIAQQVGAENRR
jgi:hypothetical protein